MEASKQFPAKDITLETIDSEYFYFKSDILAGLVTYSTDKRLAANLETITTERAKEIIEMNKQGEKPESLQPDDHQHVNSKPIDLLAGESITRFDRAKKKKKKNKAGKNKPNAPQAQGKEGNPAQRQQNSKENAQGGEQRKPKNRNNDRRGQEQRKNNENRPQRDEKDAGKKA